MDKKNNNIVPFTNPHPGEVLESELEAREISLIEFSQQSGIQLAV